MGSSAPEMELNHARYTRTTTMNERKTLQELLKELIAARNLSIEKLATISNIPSRFIKLLVEGKYKDLPSKPYVRGYLIKLAPILEIDQETLIESYDSSIELPSSGKTDNLPVNRFAVKPMNRGLIAAIVIVVILVGIIAFRFNAIIGKPEIQITVPSTSQDQTLQVTGEVKPGDSVTLNGEAIYPLSDGTFEKDVLLNPGLNTLQFTVKRFLGGETDITKQVLYQTQATSTQSTTTNTH
jgi:cytoskeletal protein RodZ